MPKKVAVIVGSLRKASWNLKLAKVLMKLAPNTLTMELIDISQLPIYNQDPDDEGHPHKEWTAFREKMKQFDAVLFVTPEYNRSVPGALKNAIDVGSRPYGKSIWSGKPAAIVSSSVGAISGFGANHHLRQSLVFLDMPCMQQPEAYIGDIGNFLDADGNLLKKESEGFLQKIMDTFAKWVHIDFTK